ncbi:MAG: peroxiredoxin [Puniceicoccales bacterium]|jgi:peroxiredoxin (alkyl hydroperoxide reductase subunit C)|nr:peroxiredoxin [Puniceicoccales bacterium]
MITTLVTHPAPLFQAKAVYEQQIEDFDLADLVGKHYIILFFYPKDFTFVCPTELHAFQDHLEEFKRRDTAVVACSTDSEYAHLAWLQMPKKQGGIQGVKYPIVADINKTISERYGILAGECIEDEAMGKIHVVGERVALRWLFLIDKQGIVQHQVVNSMPLGRSTKEALRMVDALQFFEHHGEICPANWSPSR